MDTNSKMNKYKIVILIKKDELNSWKNYRELITPGIQIFNEYPELKSLIEQNIE